MAHCGTTIKTKFRALVAAASAQQMNVVHYLNDEISEECEKDFTSYRNVARNYPDIIQSLQRALEKADKQGDSDSEQDAPAPHIKD